MVGTYEGTGTLVGLMSLLGSGSAVKSDSSAFGVGPGGSEGGGGGGKLEEDNESAVLCSSRC